MPSSRRHSRMTASWSWSARSKPGTVSAARSASSATASPRPALVPGGGTGSGSTTWTSSPGTSSGRRLVASTHSPGTASSSVSTVVAQAPTRCSQVSRTSRTSRSNRCSASTSTIGRVVWSVSLSASAMACGSSEPSTSGDSCTSQAPPLNRGRRSAAARSAMRDFPTPPTPVRVTRRERRAAWRTCSSSARRPIRLVSSAGRLPACHLPTMRSPPIGRICYSSLPDDAAPCHRK